MVTGRGKKRVVPNVFS
uniref:Uncharacterized protein n=1 Tax=Anguilla anguilla TaxID=7936 RepID=A0A0E9UFD7_ANGAN